VATAGTAVGAGSLTAVATAAKTGFETAIPVGSSAAQSGERFEVQALDARGHVISVSRPFSVASRR
ncbi:MAG TPA: hypothetical protein VGL68_07225, partial [Solirubrobacteraceae bacterium]